MLPIIFLIKYHCMMEAIIIQTLSICFLLSKRVYSGANLNYLTYQHLIVPTPTFNGPVFYFPYFSFQLVPFPQPVFQTFSSWIGENISYMVYGDYSYGLRSQGENTKLIEIFEISTLRQIPKNYSLGKIIVLKCASYLGDYVVKR